MEALETIWSPALTRLTSASSTADMPEAVSIAAVPPSSAQIFRATVSFVGFARRV